MRLKEGGIDIFYVDESMDRAVFAMSAVTIPFLRQVEGTWTLVWEDHFANARDWRRRTSKAWEIPVRKELKGSKLASGRGRFRHGEDQFPRSHAARVYRAILGDVAFLPEGSIITVVGSPDSSLYGHTRLEALLFAMFQRMRTACEKSRRNALIFFDGGHDEYRKLYRKARVFLPTGSDRGDWGAGQSSRNMPLDSFTKDANMKDSRHSFFIQIADMVSYAALLKVRAERGTLPPWQDALGLATLYDAIPVRILNTKASRKDPQGIVRL